MPDAAEFYLAFRGMMPARTLTTGEVFSPFAQSRLSAGQGPTPTSVGIHYGPSERTAAVSFNSYGPEAAWLDEQITPTTLVAILSLLQRPAAPSLSRGSRAEYAVFSPIGLVAMPTRAKTRRGGDRQRTR